MVVTWLRRPGGLFLRDWLAITLGSRIYAWRALRDDELEHELEHVRQSSVAVTERWVPLERLLPAMPFVRLGSEGRKRVAHGQMLGAAHLMGGDSERRGPNVWIRLIDEQGQLVALGTVDQTGEFLHPAVVLI